MLVLDAEEESRLKGQKFDKKHYILVRKSAEPLAMSLNSASSSWECLQVSGVEMGTSIRKARVLGDLTTCL